jgi:hypothetical protein
MSAKVFGVQETLVASRAHVRPLILIEVTRLAMTIEVALAIENVTAPWLVANETTLARSLSLLRPLPRPGWMRRRAVTRSVCVLNMRLYSNRLYRCLVRIHVLDVLVVQNWPVVPSDVVQHWLHIYVELEGFGQRHANRVLG